MSANQTATAEDIKELKELIVRNSTDLGEAINSLATSVDERFGALATAVDKRFDLADRRIDEVYTELKTDFRKLQSAVDHLTGEVVDFRIEMTSFMSQINRMDEQIHSLAMQTGSSL